MLSAGSFIPAASANIIFPALADIERGEPPLSQSDLSTFLPNTDFFHSSDLHTTPSILALSVSIFILVQGGGSITFVPISELLGRRYIYLITLLAYTVSQIVAGVSGSIGLFVAMRVIGGYASSPLLTMAAGTIADLYEVEERGTK